MVSDVGWAQVHRTEVTGWEASPVNQPQISPYSRGPSSVCIVGKPPRGAFNHCDSGEVTQEEMILSCLERGTCFPECWLLVPTPEEKRNLKDRGHEQGPGRSSYPNPPGI